MSSIERTAYPRFPRLMSARELQVFYTPTPEEITWAGEVTDSNEALLGVVLALKCYQRMGRFPKSDEVPELVIDHVRRGLGLTADVAALHGADRTRTHHRGLIRKRVGTKYNPKKAWEVAATAIREAAATMNNPPDLINVALEMLVAEALELPGFTTLDELAATIRTEVNGKIIVGIHGRITEQARAGLLATVYEWEPGVASVFTRMKKPAKRATWSRFKEQSQYLKDIDELGDTAAWVEGVAESKIADFAAEAAVQDAGTLRDYDSDKQVALLACMAHAARARARDDLADMLCKRVAVVVKKAKAELEEIRMRQRAVTEKLIGSYKSVLEQLTEDGATTLTGQAAAGMAHQALLMLTGGAEPDDEHAGEGTAAWRLAGAQSEAL